MKKQFHNANADFGYDNNIGYSVFGIDIFGKNYQSMTDMAVGLDYITKFFNSSLNTGSHDANAYINALAQVRGSNAVNLDIESLGFGIKATPLNETEVKASADNLASVASGRLPASINDFRQALINQATSTPFVDAIVDNSIVKGAQAVGDTVISVTQSAGSLVNSSVEALSTGSKIVAYAPWFFGLLAVYGIYKVGTSDLVKSTAKGLVNKRLGL